VEHYEVRTYNTLDPEGLKQFPDALYRVAGDCTCPDAIVLRSHTLTIDEIPSSVLVVGRAGSGVNNIPVPFCTEQGTMVFNAPGANAQAVCELTIALMLMGARQLGNVWHAASGLFDSEASVVEASKGAYTGIEISGRTLGIVGLGPIGSLVAHAAHYGFRMPVLAYDPYLSAERRATLPPFVTRVDSMEQLFSRSQVVSLHVPYSTETRGMIGEKLLQLLPKDSILINAARAELVDMHAVRVALDQNVLHSYATDFVSLKHARAVNLTHIGASTKEAEAMCMKMIAEQVRDYIERGQITNAVNFPDVYLPTNGGTRFCIVHKNIAGLVNSITAVLVTARLNIAEMINKHRNEYAYTIIDVEGMLSPEKTHAITNSIAVNVEGVLRVRAL
jgi:D-3-phosphoglycerate dehydrogenase / 2-oxoglutarate reductase